jgi:protein TonB
MNAGREPGCGGPGMGGALLWSAAVHLAVLASLFFVRAAASPAFPRTVQVVLVEGASGRDAAEGKPPAPVSAPGAGRAESARWREEETASQAPDSPPPLPPASTSASVSPFPGREEAGEGERFDPPSSGGPVEAPSDIPRSAEPSWGGPAAEGRPRPGSPGAPPRAGAAGGTAGREGRETRLLRERIESRIVYPAEAIRRGQEGDVLLHIRVGEGGIPKEIRVARSSGARTLDEAARNGVVRSAPLPSTPGWFEVPVRFRLR